MRGDKKVIWLVNYYAMPPKLESRLRTIKFAKYLQLEGYEVTVVSSSIMHNMNLNLIEDGRSYINREYDGINFFQINSLKYNNNGIKRYLSLFQFHLKLFFLKEKLQKPDIILHVALPPFGNIVNVLARRIRAKYIVEILDLWPESFVELGLIKRNNPFLTLLYQFERWLYESADEVVFSMEGGADYIESKKWDTRNGGKIDIRKKVHYINNGIDLSDFDFSRKSYFLDDEDLNNKEIKKVIYLGSIRKANNVIELLQAASTLKDEKDIVFLIYGDGDQRDNLIKYCESNGLENVKFKEKWIDPKFVPFVVSRADVNVLNYMSGSFGNYGGSQSKLFQYMAAGKPICCNLKMLYCQITKNKLGIATEFKSPSEYGEAINNLVKLTNKEKEEINQRAISAVQEFDYQNLTEKLIRIF